MLKMQTKRRERGEQKSSIGWKKTGKMRSTRSDPQSELQLLPPSTITKRTLGDRSFMASAPKLWNRLPSNIRAVNDLNCFKTLLKTHLFRQAFFMFAFKVCFHIF